MVVVKKLMVVSIVAFSLVGIMSTAVAQAAPLALPEPLKSWLTPPAEKLGSSWKPFHKALVKSYPGAVGISIVPVGADTAISLGTLTSVRAWSTLKVPVALAAERRLGSAVVDGETTAIRLSDNAAAEGLWAALGSNDSAVSAVTTVLREGHDTRTHVSSQADSPPSYPGYTMWALADQARFGAHLPCMPGTDRVLRLMGSVASNQRWGVANLAKRSRSVTATAVKGGWGPGTGTSSAFLVRQLAVIETARGQFAISMAAVPRSNRFEDGTAMLTRVGNWVGRNLGAVPTGSCGLG